MGTHCSCTSCFQNPVNTVSICNLISVSIKFSPSLELGCRCHLFIVPVNYGEVITLCFNWDAEKLVWVERLIRLSDYVFCHKDAFVTFIGWPK